MGNDWTTPRTTIRWGSVAQHALIERAVALSGLTKNAWMRRAALQVAEVEELIRADEAEEPITGEERTFGAEGSVDGTEGAFG